MSRKSTLNGISSQKFSRTALLIALPVLAVSVTAAVVFCSLNVFLSNGLSEKTRYSTSVTELDLSGTDYTNYTVLARCKKLKKLDLRGCDISREDYDYLASALENCEIMWDIPFGGELFDSEIESIIISNPSANDLDMLGYFDSLEDADASASELTDDLMDSLRELKDRGVACAVTLAGQKIDGSATALKLAEAGLANDKQLRFVLDIFDGLKDIDLDGCGLDEDTMRAVRGDYQNKDIHWNVDFYGQKLSTASDEIDISNTAVTDLDDFKYRILSFDRLKKIVMCDCSLSNEQMEKLSGEFPDVRFVWRVYLGLLKKWSLRTDATYFTTNIADEMDNVYRLQNEDMEIFKYCPDMEHLDIGHSCVNDLSFLKWMPKLKTLIVASGKGTKLRDISPIAELKDLQYLELFDQRISDLTPLQNLDKLIDLNICRNNITDVTPLLKMTSLERLWINQCFDLEEEEVEKIREALPMCQVVSAFGYSTSYGWRKHERFYEMREHFGIDTTELRNNNKIPKPYDVLPEDYLTHYNSKYDALKKGQQ